ncbi:hypothetical protein FEV51_02505 [Qipengyuania marisflavi]|uniref:Lipoxygenase domain-containing protein n=1 Tax=Qipengyuania marisflavi TaxID=2486356 RepID=A0A5S3P9B3_9SPHN|nr:hypothetical protein FEV51_02505 [Qipengyuania marisflavi]
MFAYVTVYYDGDEAVAQDSELSQWAIAVAGEGKLKGFPDPQTVGDLVAICTMIIFTASAQHAAVNFPQKAIMEYAPAVTGAAWQPVPASFDGLTKQKWLALIPTQAEAIEQLKVLYLLGSLYYRPLGCYKSPDKPYPDWFTDPRIVGAGGPLPEFQSALQTVEQEIVARNSERRWPYPFLQPSLIPTSTNI